MALATAKSNFVPLSHDVISAVAQVGIEVGALTVTVGREERDAQ